MKIFNLLFALLLVTITTSAQYIIADKDGYTNVRKEPNSKSEILGQIKALDVFYEANSDCSMQEDPRAAQGDENWLPILIDDEWGNFIGFVYKNNIKDVQELPQILEKKEGNIHIFNDDKIQISIETESIDNSRFWSKSGDSYDLKNGSGPIIYHFENENQETVKNISITFGNEKYDVPEIFYYDLRYQYNGMRLGVYTYDNRVYYLTTGIGDASETAEFIYVISKDKYIRRYIHQLCGNVPYLRLESK